MNTQLSKIWKNEIKNKFLLKFPKTNDQISFAIHLMKSKFAEEKFLAIDIFQLQVKKISLKKNNEKLNESIIIIINTNELINQIDKELFQGEHIYDWGTCDSFSSKVIAELIKKDKSITFIIKQWKDSSNCWQQRSSCVSFVKLARFGEFNETIIEIVSKTINNNYRFVQLGTGWVLRELSLNDLDLVKKFIRNHYMKFSREGLRYAIEKMDSKLRKELLDEHKEKTKKIN
jgi:3-methyladenine DNA glycosylase AlkD